MATQYRISLDLAPLFGAAQRAMDEAAPRLRLALESIAEKTRDVWRKDIRQAPGIWWVERNRYIESLNIRFIGPLSIEIGTPYPVADWIERGRPERDLKRYLDTSHKVRRTETGRRFLVIPFRHNTPGHDALAPSMSPQAYAMAKHLSFSRSVAKIERHVGQTMILHPTFGMLTAARQPPYLSDIKTRKAAMTEGRAYAWGDRLSARMLRAAGFDRDDVRRHAGMVRMKNDAFSNRSGGYMTFRVMAEGQSGWIVPAKPGLWIAKQVADKMGSIAPEIMAEELRRP